MILYLVHNLVDISIDTRVGKPLIDAVDFQIGYFKLNVGSKIDSFHKIVVKPYDDFRPDPFSVFRTFHLCRGLPGYCIHDELNGFAIEKHNRGFTIYSSSPNFLINLYIQLLLLENGYSMVHSAGIVDNKGYATLLAGPGGVGKTALLGYMVKGHGLRQMGDDIVLVGVRGDCLSFPRSFILKDYHQTVYPEVFNRLKIRKRTGYGIKRFVIENAPFVGIMKKVLRKRGLYYDLAHSINMLPYLAAVPVQEIFGPKGSAERGCISQVVFLERYEGSQFRVDNVKENEICRRLFAIMQHEWVASMQQFFTLAAMDIADLPHYFQKMASIISSAISGKSCQILTIPKTATPKDLLDAYDKMIKPL